LDGVGVQALVAARGAGSTLANSLLRILMAGPCWMASALMSRNSEFWIVTPEDVSEP